MPRAPKIKVTKVARPLHECYLCGIGFITTTDLKRHLPVHGSHDEKPYKCEYPDCPFTATQKQALDTHVESVHEKTKRHECNFCDKRYGDRSTRHKHMVSKHGYKPAERKAKAQPKFKATSSFIQEKPYSPPSQPTKRSYSPTPDFVPPSIARKSFASSYYVDTPVSEPAPVSSHHTPEQGFVPQQFSYSPPQQQSYYSLSAEYFSRGSQSYSPTPEYSIPRSQVSSLEPTPELRTPSPMPAPAPVFSTLSQHKHPLRYGFPSDNA